MYNIVIYYISTDDDQIDPISNMFHQTDTILNCCTSKGDLYVCDLRCEKVKVTCCYSVKKEQQGYWTMTKLNDQSDSLVLVSSLGDAIVLGSNFREKCIRKTCDILKGKEKYLCVQVISHLITLFFNLYKIHVVFT